MNISWSFDFVTDFFEPATTERSKFHILPLLYFYSWVVNTFNLPELQIEQTYCDYFKNIEKDFSIESKNSTKINEFFLKKKKNWPRKKNWPKKKLAEKKFGWKKNGQKKIWPKKKSFSEIFFGRKKYWLKEVLAEKSIEHATIHAPVFEKKKKLKKKYFQHFGTKIPKAFN